MCKIYSPSPTAQKAFPLPALPVSLNPYPVACNSSVGTVHAEAECSLAFKPVKFENLSACEIQQWDSIGETFLLQRKKKQKVDRDRSSPKCLKPSRATSVRLLQLRIIRFGSRPTEKLAPLSGPTVGGSVVSELSPSLQLHPHSPSQQSFSGALVCSVLAHPLKFRRRQPCPPELCLWGPRRG